MEDLIFDVQLFAAVESSSIETFTVTGDWDTGSKKNVAYSANSSDTAVTKITTLLGTDLAAKVNLEWSTETATGIKISAKTTDDASGTASDVYAALKAICADTTNKYAVTLTSALNIKAGDTLTLTQRLNIGSGCTALNIDGTITDNSSFVSSSGVLIQHAAAGQELTITGNKTGKIQATGTGNDNSGSSSAILVAGNSSAATLKLVGVTVESAVVGINHVQNISYKSVVEVDPDSTVYGKLTGIIGGLGEGSNITVNGTVKSDNTAVAIHYGKLTVGEDAVITGGSTNEPTLTKFDSDVYSVSNCVANAAIEISPVTNGNVTTEFNGGTVTGGIMLAAPEGAESVEFDSADAGSDTTLTIAKGNFKGSIIQDESASGTTVTVVGGTFELAAGDYFTDANGVKYTATTAPTVTLTANNTSNPAKISKVEFGNTGTVVATLPKAEGLTLDNVNYLSGNDTVTYNDTVTITNGKVSAVGTGKVKAVIGKVTASTNGVTIDGVTYNSTDTTNGGTVVFDNGKASVGTAVGVVTATIAESSKNGVVADNITFTGKNGTVVLTTTGDTPATAANISDDSTGTIVATFSATASTNGITVGKLKYTGAATTDSVTFEKNAYSTSKGNITATTTGALTGDEELKVAGNTYKVTDAGTMTFTLKDNVLIGIADLSTTSDSISGDFTSLKTINGATGTITISGDKDVQLVGSTTTGQVSEVKNVGGTVTITGAAVAAANITTDNVGSFKLGNTSAITLAGTDSVVGFTLAESAVTAVTGFDAAGTISGALNGIKFSNTSTQATNAVQVTKDTDFAVVNDGTDLSLANISNGAVISNAGGMTKVVTDEAGTFSFGTSQKVTVTGDTSVNFTLGDNSTVTAVDSIASATLSVSSDTTSISINGGDAITFAAADKKTPTFVIDSAGKITEVSGASVVSGLTGDVNVIETSSAKIGTTDINITGDSSYAVSVVSGAVGEISSISANATVSMANATVNTDQNGKFTFGGVEYNIAGDTNIQVVTGTDSLLSAVTGLEGTIATTDKEISINGDEVKIEVASADAASVVTYTGSTAGIASITGLTNGAVVTGATNAALNLVGTTSTSVATSLTANGKLFQLLNDSDGVTITGGEVVTGLGSGASLVAANAGTYTVNGTELNVAAGETIRGTSEGTAEIYSAENVSEVDSVTAASVESLASALGIDTSDYATVANDAVEAAISSSASAADKELLNGNMKFAVSVPSGANKQDVDLSANTGVKDVTLTTGDQSLKFNNEGGNVAQVGAEAKGTKDIELGGGGDIAIIAKGTKATVNVVAGKGSDSIVSGANASVDVGNGGATKVRAIGGATVTMNNYNAADSKAGVQTTNSDIAAAIGNGNITLENGVIGTSEGKVALNSGSSSSDVVASADSGDTEGSTIANLYNNAGKMIKVGFTHNEGGTVDLSGQKANTVIQGNNAATNKSGESTLLGGSGNDYIYAGSGDAVDAGAGANTIVLKQADKRSADAEKGATIAMTSATGRNTVKNFNTGFEDGKDAISVDLTNAKFTVDGEGNLIIKNGRAKTTVVGAASTSGDVSADATNGVANVLITDASGTTTKTAVAGEGKTIAVSADEENFANSYIGDGSGLSFSGYESEVNLNLAGTTATFGGEEVQVSGINNVVLGEADATVFGSDAKETIAAGNGNETIWAGKGKDTLIGYSGNADDKSGAITFGFIEGDGKDVITNFGYLTTENAQTADRVWTTGEFAADLSGSDVVLSFSGNKKDSLRLTGMAGKNIQLSEKGDLANVTTVLQVSDTLLTYEGLATKYIATGSNAAVVASSLASSANIWLEDKYVNLSNNTTYTGKITAINAAAVEGQATLVGNSYNNVITGAQGSSSMWGGEGTSNDTLIGGTEGNMFFYGVTGGNEGNDSISGVTGDDTVNLFGIQLSDISDFDITNSTIALKFSAGGSLTMGNNGQTFMLANDQNQRYTYDKENSEWTKA